MSVAAVGTIGAAVVGGVMAGNAADKQASATREASQGQQMIQMEQLAMQKQQWQRYIDTYAPLEDAYAAEAQNVGSIANQNQAAGKVQAANAAAYASARERLSKNPGMNPSEQQYLQQSNKINLAEAAGSAVGQNDAREKVIAAGDARKVNALSLGKGMPANAASSLNAAGATGSGLMSSGINAANAQYANDSKAASGLGNMIGGITQSKTFQNWINSPSTTTVTGPSITPDAAAALQGNFFSGTGSTSD